MTVGRAEEHEKSGSGIGLAIQQLRAVVSQQEKARAALGKWTELVGEGKAEWHIRRMDGQAAEASKLLAEAEKDNDEVYFAAVPSDAPPAVEAKVFVTAMPVGENAEYNNAKVEQGDLEQLIGDAPVIVGSEVGPGSGDGEGFRPTHLGEARAAQAMFRAMDTDGSGLLDASELQLRCSDFGMDDSAIDELFSALDANSDGMISLDEFTAGYDLFTSGRSESLAPDSTFEGKWASSDGWAFDLLLVVDKVEPSGAVQGHTDWMLRAVPSKHQADFGSKIGKQATELWRGKRNGREVAAEGYETQDPLGIIATGSYKLVLRRHAAIDDLPDDKDQEKLQVLMGLCAKEQVRLVRYEDAMEPLRELKQAAAAEDAAAAAEQQRLAALQEERDKLRAVAEARFSHIDPKTQQPVAFGATDNQLIAMSRAAGEASVRISDVRLPSGLVLEFEVRFQAPWGRFDSAPESRMVQVNLANQNTRVVVGG